MAVINDRRTEAQKQRLTLLVVGTDKVLSGWGQARGGASFLAFACDSKTLDQVLKMARDRTDLYRVRVVIDSRGSPYRPSRTCKHLSIVVPAVSLAGEAS